MLDHNLNDVLTVLYNWGIEGVEGRTLHIVSWGSSRKSLERRKVGYIHIYRNFVCLMTKWRSHALALLDALENAGIRPLMLHKRHHAVFQILSMLVSHNWLLPT